MPRLSETQIMADAIIRTHDGKAYFNFTEASKIIGCGVNTIPDIFYNAGIIVKKVGPSKRVSAYDIASVMCLKRVAAIQ